jgi:rhamnose utilization protein RhaD (predicted bifunctional aldolase and dehydrogenase)/NAD(P)-dependent dehydrogenase (short-subunit alcohol dehydrogenase family)
MESRWSDAAADRLIEEYRGRGIGRDLALRVYTSRLLGRDPRLVLHGGGNTSVKTVQRDMLGDEVAVLCVKGSGWDMAEIEPAGLPAVRLEPLRRLRSRARLSDEEMVNFQRINLLDAAAPNPSVETLLHAFLPAKFVDHTHSTAALSLADQPDGGAICREVFGRRVGLVPYIMPGFALAKKAAEIYEADPTVEGLILLKHGIFTFGETAREAYERMIAMVSLAEDRIAAGRSPVFAARALPLRCAEAAAIAPIIRGACSVEDPRNAGAYARFILEFRTGDAIRTYLDGADLGRYATAGVATPDHTIRTKNYPLIVPPPDAADLVGFERAVRDAVAGFAAEYARYFTRRNATQPTPKRALDPMPRVVLVPGVGLFGLGRSARDARIAADIAEGTIATVTGAEAIGRFESLPEADLFDMEYWSLEQAKLGTVVAKRLAGQVAVITGGGGTIGAATARLLAREGAEVAVLDRDLTAAKAVAKAIGGAALGLACDVTDPQFVKDAFAAVCGAFGGIDIVVSNAGAAWQGKIGEVEDAVLRRSFELNFFGHQTVAQEAVRIMRQQGTGGALLFNVSKQAINPGADFGPYGLPKAATLFLMRQYALDYGADGIRSNAVNADRIRSGLLTEDMIRSRAAARGVGEAEYLAGNLLRREVTAEDVAQAFLYHALALKTTADVTTVDGGNINAILR